MSNFLNKYATEAAYNTAKAAEGFRPSTSLVDGQAKYDPALFSFNPKYLYSDLSTGTSTSAPSGESIIGVEVIPASHTPNRKARYVSLKNMSRTDVAEGTIETDNNQNNSAAMIPWGVYNEDVECLTAFENYPKPLKNDGTHPLNEIDWNSENDGYYTPADTNELEAPLSYSFEFTNRYWYGDDGIGNFLPYPFLPGGERNPMFGQPGTALADMNGLANTKKLASRAVDLWDDNDHLQTDVANHKTYPAAVACHYFTAGVSDLEGRWYLPAEGELAYLWANIAKINEKIAAAVSAGASGVCIGMGISEDYPCYNTSGNEDGLGDWLWSSSQRSSDNAWNLYTDSGYSNYNSKDYTSNYCRVRAFLQL